MYQALYRKWRPASFDEVSGQEHITDTLRRQVISGKLSHAYLFTGTHGTGKTSCAKILSKAVNCENPENGNPCNKCTSCIGIDNGSIMDVTEMDAASNNGVENVRTLREEAVYMPTAAKKRVYIIDEVHMLSNAAFNALLKIMEEPPEHLMFILATTELHKVPATILSRCQKYSFKRIHSPVIINRLQYIASQEGLQITDDATVLLARLSNGSMRDAISLLDQCAGNDLIDRQRVLDCIGIAENDEICRLFEDILRGNGFGAIERLTALYTGGKDVSSVLGQLTALHRDILLTKLAPKGSDGLLSGAFKDEDISGLSQSITVSHLLTNVETLQSAIAKLDSVDRKTAAEICLLRLIEHKPEQMPVTTRNESLSTNAANPVDSTSDSPNYKHVQTQAEHVSISENKSDVTTPEKHTPTAKSETSGSDRSWKTLLESLSKQMDPFLYSLLDDTTHAEGCITGNSISISAKSPFSMNLIDTNDCREIVKSAAENLWNDTFSVTVGEAKPNQANIKSKLEKLSRFDNIKFE